ncbi:hypothetical protein pb186bvf_017347 [Paramecium bursaria]
MRVPTHLLISVALFQFQYNILLIIQERISSIKIVLSNKLILKL